jgi:aminomethyltransferase
MRSRSGQYDVTIGDITDRTTMIAVQGPSAIGALQPLTSLDLSGVKRLTHVDCNVGGSRATITRSGYTGEDGFEVILHDSGIEDASAALSVWGDLSKRAKPCGLGARDSLRIESGLPLYGYDIDETTNAVDADLQWVVSREKTGYVGDEATIKSLASPPNRLRRGIILDDRIPRHGFEIRNATGERVGHVTSGTFSPILKKGIALGYLSLPCAQPGQDVQVLVRDSPTRGTVVKPPFYDQKLYGWKRISQQAK